MNSREKDFADKRLEPSDGVLYIIGTPIGNLGDLSPRARSILKNVSLIACEDTRRSGQLIRRLESKVPLISFHSHNTSKRIPELLSHLSENKSLALISDAGIPGISDPGENLVASVKKAGFKVIAIPGACAAITALVSSGLPTARFCFEGFLPIKEKERKKRLKEISSEIRTSIIYESPHKLIQLLKELETYCGHDRPLQIGRELTKMHEQHIGPNIATALKHFLEIKPKGEFTLILGGNTSAPTIHYKDAELLEKMRNLVQQGYSSNEAAKEIAFETNQSKRYLYEILHKTLGSPKN